jgi:hypothetical protein
VTDAAPARRGAASEPAGLESLGRIVLTEAPVPAGAKPPSGTIITMTIDSKTKQGLDGGIEDAMPDLYAMGEPEPLRLPGGVTR